MCTSHSCGTDLMVTTAAGSVQCPRPRLLDSALGMESSTGGSVFLMGTNSAFGSFGVPSHLFTSIHLPLTEFFFGSWAKARDTEKSCSKVMKAKPLHLPSLCLAMKTSVTSPYCEKNSRRTSSLRKFAMPPTKTLWVFLPSKLGSAGAVETGYPLITWLSRNSSLNTVAVSATSTKQTSATGLPLLSFHLTYFTGPKVSK
mmetsp:Transcript_29153/g.64187  ORF Transcript_29153/g.64187 Transcript_29153/m.64187 type:complete len:200 (+) Transcript_29153:299-898(+)